MSSLRLLDEIWYWPFIVKRIYPTATLLLNIPRDRIQLTIFSDFLCPTRLFFWASFHFKWQPNMIWWKCQSQINYQEGGQYWGTINLFPIDATAGHQSWLWPFPRRGDQVVTSDWWHVCLIVRRAGGMTSPAWPGLASRKPSQQKQHADTFWHFQVLQATILLLAPGDTYKLPT